MTGRAPRAGDAAGVPNPERGSEDRRVHDPLGRRVPMVDGPTGSAPLSSELHGDPEGEGDRGTEKGVMGGVVAGTAVAGPIGGLVGAVIGGVAGATTDESTDGDAAAWTSDPSETAGTVVRGGTTEPEPPPG